MAYKAKAIVLDEETRKVLEARVRATTTPQRDVTRARIILLAADRIASRQISQRVGMHESHVAMWRQRFLAQGLKGLADAPPPRAPRHLRRR